MRGFNHRKHKQRARTERRARRGTARTSPWSFRRRHAIQRVADLHGREVPVRVFNHNGQRREVAECDDPFGDTTTPTPEPSRLPLLLRWKAAEMAAYRMSKTCSEKELRTIDALWGKGLTLREHARREGVRPQAIESRIARLRERAVRFWTWWRLKNRMRARR